MVKCSLVLSLAMPSVPQTCSLLVCISEHYSRHRKMRHAFENWRACVAGRFNERLVLSLASNTNCMLMDDELNILPISSHVRDGMKPIPLKEDGTPDVPGSSDTAAELRELTESLRDVQARPVARMIYL